MAPLQASNSVIPGEVRADVRRHKSVIRGGKVPLLVAFPLEPYFALGFFVPVFFGFFLSFFLSLFPIVNLLPI